MKDFFRKNKYLIGASAGGIVLGTLLTCVGAPVIGILLIGGGIGGICYLVIKN